MSESLLGFLLARLDQIDAPVFLHRELEPFPADDLVALTSGGILRETTPATELSGNMVVKRTSQGLFGVAAEGEPYFDPVPLGEDDIRQYEVSLPRLVDHIRRENGIDGTRFEDHGGLIPLGQRVAEGSVAMDVYLSLPNDEESRVIARCQRLMPSPESRRAVLVTPRCLMLSPEGRRVIASSGLVTLVLQDSAAGASLAIDWSRLSRGADESTPAAASHQEQAGAVQALSEPAERILDALRACSGHPWPGSAALCRAAGTQRGKRRSPMHRATFGSAVRELVDAGVLDLRGKSRPRKGGGWALLRRLAHES